MEIKTLHPRILEAYDWDKDNNLEDTDFWDNSYQSDYPEYTMEALGRCCGAGFHEDSVAVTTTRAVYGIDIYPGLIGKGQTSKTTHRTHLKTKNGDMTIAVRIAPFEEE